MSTDDGTVLQDWFLLLAMTGLGSVVWLGACAFPLVVLGDRDNVWSGILIVASQGLIVGIAQWFVIRWHIRQTGWWVLATMVGLPLGLWIGLGIVNRFSSIDLPSAVVAVAIGTSLGLLQWFVLHGKIQHALYWAVANPVIWGLAGSIGNRSTALLNGPSAIVSPLASSLGQLISWALAEGTTGLLLAWLLHQPILHKTIPGQLQARTESPISP